MLFLWILFIRGLSRNKIFPYTLQSLKALRPKDGSIYRKTKQNYIQVLQFNFAAFIIIILYSFIFTFLLVIPFSSDTELPAVSSSKVAMIK